MHAFTTIATGGFSNSDTSFFNYGASAEYVSCLFMILAALPFVRYVQLVSGNTKPFFRDSQIRTFMLVILVLALILTIWYAKEFGDFTESTVRKSFFSIISIITGTGYVSVDYGSWGPFAVSFFFFLGLIGGCAGSTSCSIKIFRFQLLFASIKTQIQRVHSPNGIFSPRYEGRVVQEDVLSSVILSINCCSSSVPISLINGCSIRCRRLLYFRYSVHQSRHLDIVLLACQYSFGLLH